MKKTLLLLLFISLVFSCSKETIKYTLTTSANPSDGGVVIPSTAIHDEGTSVNITASPSSIYLFSYWSGDASGTDANSSIVMNADKNVVANFKEKTPTKIKFKVDQYWDDKRYFKYESKDAGVYVQTKTGCNPPLKYLTTAFQNNGDPYEDFGGKKALWNAVDSLTIDFSTFPNDLKNIYINVLPGTQHRRAALEKIGYIKIIGDTLGRRIYIDFIRAKIGFGAFPRDPILYADSNIDFSNLIYHRHVNPINNCGEKISLTDFSKFFKKESLNKDAGYYIWNYDSNSTIKDKKIGDKITKNDGYLLITGIEYLYD